MADAHKAAGSASLLVLIKSIGDMSSATCTPDKATDGRDYLGMSMLVQQSIAENLRHPDPDHREGYLRSLTDLLCMVADGCCPPSEGWDPITNTAAAFKGLQASSTAH